MSHLNFTQKQEEADKSGIGCCCTESTVPVQRNEGRDCWAEGSWEATEGNSQDLRSVDVGIGPITGVDKDDFGVVSIRGRNTEVGGKGTELRSFGGMGQVWRPAVRAQRTDNVLRGPCRGGQ